MKISRLTAVGLMALTVAACGGGGGGGGGSSTPTPTDPTPVDPTPVTPLPADDPSVPVATLTRTAPSTGCTVAQLTGGKGDYGLEIKDVSWLQVVQQDMVDEDSRLAAKKETRVRIDVTTSLSNVPMPASAKLVLGTAAGGCQTIALTSAATMAPTAVDRTTLDKSYVGVIPAGQLTADVVTWQIAVDDLKASSVTAAGRLYRTGTVEIEPEITENIVVRPIAFQGQTGALPSEADIKALLKRTYPHNDFTITYEAATTPDAFTAANAESVSGGVYTFAWAQVAGALNELEFECRQTSPMDVRMDPNGLPRMNRCFSAFPANIRLKSSGGAALSGVAAGLAMLTTGFTSADNAGISTPYDGSHWLNSAASTLVHEFGHLMFLKHAACGTTDQLDADLYADGRIGSNGGGYDTGRGYYFSTAGGTFSDVMSYCGKGWTSDLGYRKVLAFKQGELNTAATDVTAARIMAMEAHDGHDHAAPAVKAPPVSSGKITVGEQRDCKIVNDKVAGKVVCKTVPDAASERGYKCKIAGDKVACDNQVIRFYKIKGAWVPRLGHMMPNTVRSTAHPDAGFISPALKGLPLYTIETHYGELDGGPFDIKATPQALALVKGLLSPGEQLKF